MEKCGKTDCEFNTNKPYFENDCRVFDDVKDCTLYRFSNKIIVKLYKPKVIIAKGSQTELF